MKTHNRRGFAILPIVIIGAAAIIAAGAVFSFVNSVNSEKTQVAQLQKQLAQEDQEIKSLATSPHLDPGPPSFGASGSPAVQGQAFALAGSGITATQTSTLLTKFTLSDGSTVITIGMFGSGGVGYGVIEPGTTREENVSFTGVTQNNDGSALLTGVTRGLTFSYPCVSTSSLQKAHAGGVKFVLSNSNCFYQNFLTQQNDASITAQYEYSKAPYVDSPSTNASATVTYGQLASTSFSGTVNASLVQKGIVQEATQAQMASGTLAGSTGADLVISNRYASLTASTSPVVVIASNTIDKSFFAAGTNYGFTNQILGITTATSTATSTDSFNILPAGVVQMYAATTTIPAGWLLADGSFYATSSYPRLFTVIGYTYGGSTSTFAVPNFKSRIPVGLDASNASTSAIGQTGGQSSTTISQAQLPNVSFALGPIGGKTLGSGSNFTNGWNGTGGTSDTGSTIVANSGGSGASVSVMNPYITMNFIIKY